MQKFICAIETRFTGFLFSVSDPLLTIPSSAERKASGSVLTNFGNE